MHADPQPPRRALFLDRDGVIHEDVGYIHQPADVRWIPGIFELCATARELGYAVVIVTNQAGIGRGLYTQQQFDEFTAWMRSQFADRSVPLAGVYHCPFHPEHGLGEYLREHEDRKPGPGMLLRAARDLHLDLARSVLVGDRCTDLAAAHAAGLAHAFLIAGTESEACTQAHQLITSLDEVALWLRRAAGGLSAPAAS